jgi:hypothetical protein
MLMLACARTLPINELPVSSVAELPTCQKMFGGQLVPPLFDSTTCEADAVVSVLPILKRKNAFGFPSMFNVRVPVKAADVSKQYTPGVSVIPPRSCPVRFVPHGVAAAAL